MARGHTDYLKSVGVNARGRAQGIVEEGVVWFHDDFNDTPLKWIQSLGTVARTTTGATATVQSEVFRGTAALKITSPVAATGLAEFDFAGPPADSNVAFEVTFQFNANANHSNIIRSLIPISFAWRVPFTVRNIELTYRPANNTWYLTNQGGSSIVASTIQISPDIWHTVRLEVDPVRNVFVELVIDGSSADLSANSLFSSSYSGSTFSEYTMQCNGSAGNQAVLIVDDVRILRGVG